MGRGTVQFDWDLMALIKLQAVGKKAKKVVPQQKIFTEIYLFDKQGTKVAGDMVEELVMGGATDVQFDDDPINAELVGHSSLMLGEKDKQKEAAKATVESGGGGSKTVESEVTMENSSDNVFQCKDGPNRSDGPKLTVAQMTNMGQTGMTNYLGENECFSPQIKETHIILAGNVNMSGINGNQVLAETQENVKIKGKGVLVEKNKGRKNLKIWKRKARDPIGSSKTGKRSIEGGKQKIEFTVETKGAVVQSASNKRAFSDEVCAKDDASKFKFTTTVSSLQTC
ncbi:unnamed protein product [Ilex paraguariensis]|uniref:Uncharacterized protein n=1 Tax=Ilex paraguariensis TaxID=185542 RepID=A0ABC8TLW1_9AQUA